MTSLDPVTVYEGRHLSMRNRGGWEYVSRNTSKPAVGIVAVTDEGSVLLVEQHRPPVERTVMELPAGLSGDIPGREDEALLEAAKRELLEETGYSADRWTELATGYSSPGLTDESITLFLAEGLRREAPGGGDGDEHIVVHEVPLAEVLPWLTKRRAIVDLKLLAGLFAANEYLRPK
ncbi:MAG: NUDIX hydrolase [Pirellulales bacterium]